jgi:hypothetical protein
VYIYYVTAVPRDLLDAARVDGCGEWLTFRRGALPLAKPVVALVFFFSFVADWNNFFLPLRRHRGLVAVSDPGRALGPAVLDALVQPGPRWRRCGKTTALRMVGGLEDITEGTVRIGERIVNDLVAEEP